MKDLPQSVLQQKIHACWLGKNIGGTLGGPHEGQASRLDLSFYEPVPTRPMPNDDLDLQVVWLHYLLEGRYREITPDILAGAWARHVYFPFDEYAIARRNDALGAKGIARGATDNFFGESMGAAIRSELWACVAAGDPKRAAALAWADASVDHCGDGVYAEMFHAAMQAAAFVESNREKLIDIGLSFVPTKTRLGQALRETQRLARSGRDWRAIREVVVRRYATGNFTDVVCNLCFELIGWYAGKGDFGQSLCIAVNCGLDTDCTGATLGALLGIIDPSCIPSRWVEPVGEEVVLSPQLANVVNPGSLTGLTESTLRLREQLRHCSPRIGRVVKHRPARKGDPVASRVRFETSDTPTVEPTKRLGMPVASRWRRAERVGHWWRLGAADFKGKRTQMFRFKFRVEQPHPVKVMAFYLHGLGAWVNGKKCITIGPSELTNDPFIAPSFHRAGRAAHTFDFRRLPFGENELVLALNCPPPGKTADLVFGAADAATNFWLPNIF